ncbi:uncharacterized protein LOC129599057 isoform X3 [Paramacrobiotus metropolitanus]|nr:uncharacterized protein LOC129599057 isoform X3 [Paramacrobiotus metropolitanus]
MHIYGHEDGAVYAWNSVDVLVDGVLQHGRVINAAKTGLVVDFECRIQRVQFIEYGRAFHMIKPPYDLDARRDRDVQVLLRADPEGPWRWFRGAMVPGGDLSSRVNAYIVEAEMPHGTIKELLPRQQVRRPPSDDQLAQVWPKEFVMRECELPAVWSGMSRMRLKKACGLYLPRLRDVWCARVRKWTLLYVQRSRALRSNRRKWRPCTGRRRRD